MESPVPFAQHAHLPHHRLKQRNSEKAYRGQGQPHKLGVHGAAFKPTQKHRVKFQNSESNMLDNVAEPSLPMKVPSPTKNMDNSRVPPSVSHHIYDLIIFM